MVGKHDIVHAQGLCGLRHTVATAHFVQPAWHAAQAQFCGSTTWKQRIAQWLIAPLERRALVGRGVRRVIAVSGRTAADIRQHYGRTRGVSIIHHGVDAETFHPGLRAQCRPNLLKQLGLAEDAVLALFAGNLQKGGAAAVETIARVPGVHLLLATASDTRAIMNQAHHLGCGDRVHALGFSTHLERWLAAADMLLYPTFFDTFGLVIAEAMACGIPVITTMCAGASDLVKHGKTGWLVDDPRNIGGLAEGVRLLVNDAGLRTCLGNASRAVAEKRTWDAVAEETMAVYRAMLEEPGW
jgi:UDP-glucose:(heptosyl)LPS alpha-1,3-glucosyltransferase